MPSAGVRKPLLDEVITTFSSSAARAARAFAMLRCRCRVGPILRGRSYPLVLWFDRVTAAGAKAGQRLGCSKLLTWPARSADVLDIAAPLLSHTRIRLRASRARVLQVDLERVEQHGQPPVVADQVGHAVPGPAAA